MFSYPRIAFGEPQGNFNSLSNLENPRNLSCAGFLLRVIF